MTALMFMCGTTIYISITAFSSRGTPHLGARHLTLFVTNFESALLVAVMCFTVSVWSPEDIRRHPRIHTHTASQRERERARVRERERERESERGRERWAGWETQDASRVKKHRTTGWPRPKECLQSQVSLQQTQIHTIQGGENT